MVREVGKNWAEADGDTAEAIDFCEYYAREALRYAKGLPVVQTEDQNECHYVPLGVGAIIAPWNFPLAILCGMTVAALVTGNTVVMKPAEPSLTIGRKFFELLEQVGFPRGVASFLAGQGRVVGAAMVAHPRTRFVAFTGSKEVGLRLAEQCGKTVPASAGSSASWPRWAARTASSSTRTPTSTRRPTGIVASAFGFQGQKCSACSRAIVVASVYDAVLEKVVARTKALKVGDPSDPETHVGPVTGKDQFDKILEYVEIGRKEGRVVAGGGRRGDVGYFIEPTVVADVPPTGAPRAGGDLRAGARGHQGDRLATTRSRSRTTPSSASRARSTPRTRPTSPRRSSASTSATSTSTASAPARSSAPTPSAATT